LSAQIAVSSPYHAATFELRLRNSVTGVQSALIAHASITYTGNWIQITGTVTANANYDRVVLRAYQEGGFDLVDEVHMCQAATQIWACTASAPNLVQNPSFEQVSGPGPWSWVLGATATVVPHWTQANVTFSHPYVGEGWPPDGVTAFQGIRNAVIPKVPFGYQDQGIAGELYAPTNVGTAYVMSVRITRGPYWQSATSTFELRLRNSATGAESAPVVQASGIFQDSWPNWVLLTGVVTPNANYDRVVLRYHSGSYNIQDGYVDDVHLCEATAAPLHPAGWWTMWSGLTVGLVVVILGGLLVWGLRRKRRDHQGTVTLVR
jgi:hypothetical protein